MVKRKRGRPKKQPLSEQSSDVGDEVPLDKPEEAFQDTEGSSNVVLCFYSVYIVMCFLSVTILVFIINEVRAKEDVGLVIVMFESVVNVFSCLVSFELK